MKGMKSWTIPEMEAEDPCEYYTRERLEEIWAGRKRMTLLDINRHPDIPDAHKIWANCRDHEHREKWAEVFQTRCIKKHAVGSVIDEWAQKWLSGEDRTVASARAAWGEAERAEAERAKAAAAKARAARAAWWAELAALSEWSSAWSEWSSAASAAARAEATKAARATERKHQVQDMIEILTERENTT